MKKYIIEDVQSGMSEGGMCCGMMLGPCVAEVRLFDPETNERVWYSVAEFQGLYFYKTDKSTILLQLNEGILPEEEEEAEYSEDGEIIFDDELEEEETEPLDWNARFKEFCEYIQSVEICYYDSYSDFYRNFPSVEKEDPEFAFLLKYLVALVQGVDTSVSDRGHCKPQDGPNIGKRLGEFTIGVSEEELEYIKERMYEDEEEDAEEDEDEEEEEDDEVEEDEEVEEDKEDEDKGI